ncbi:MAG: nucleoside hydrolase [Clostridia bacterium]|nr:nucleoside hydrolase [Clostridia bacterium]
MNKEQLLRNLEVPAHPVDVILDTDAFNEIDDQYAIAYLLRNGDKLRTKAIYAAPFFNEKVSSPAEGMEKSYGEIQRLLKLLGKDTAVYKGSMQYLLSDKTPVISPASLDLAERANQYSPENPLYVVAIGAITNVASAILLNPAVRENTVVVWLGGHALHYHDSNEFNMRQDIGAARIVFGCGVPLVQLPCQGVVSAFTISMPELECWFKGKNALSDYLTDITLHEMERRGAGNYWAKPLWDVTAVAWLLNTNNRFMLSRTVTAPLPSFDNLYTQKPAHHPMQYIYLIHKPALMQDLIKKMTEN